MCDLNALRAVAPFLDIGLDSCRTCCFRAESSAGFVAIRPEFATTDRNAASRHHSTLLASPIVACVPLRRVEL